MRVIAAMIATIPTTQTPIAPSGGRQRLQQPGDRAEREHHDEQDDDQERLVARAERPDDQRTSGIPGVRSMTNEPTDRIGLAEALRTPATSSPAPSASDAEATPDGGRDTAPRVLRRAAGGAVASDGCGAVTYFFSAFTIRASALPDTHTSGIATAASATGFGWNRTPRLSPT